MKSLSLKKADLILICALLAVGLAAACFLLFTNRGGSEVVLTVNGEEYGRYPLGVDRVIEVDTQYGHNEVTIKNNTVAVTDSDCPGHDCQNFGAIGQVRQTITCLPHKLLITIDGESDVDVVMK